MCSSGLLWFIFWHPLNSVMGWFFDSVEFNMDMAMLQFLQLCWFSTTESVRFFFFLINIMQLDSSANFFCCDINWCWQFFFSPFFLLCLLYAPQTSCSSVCLEFAPLSQNIMEVWLVFEYSLLKIGHSNCYKNQNQKWCEVSVKDKGFRKCFCFSLGVVVQSFNLGR